MTFNCYDAMKLFIYESISAGGFGDDPPASLRAEGRAMLTAVAEDFSRIATVTTLLAANQPALAGVRCERTTCEDEPRRYRELIAEHDAVLVIAPETDGILAERSTWVLDAGRWLLGSRPDAVVRTADKFALGQHWIATGVPTPPTRLLSHVESPEDRATGGSSARANPQEPLRGAHGRTSRPWHEVEEFPESFPVVIKPRDGAGSQATCLVNDAASWQTQLEMMRSETPGRDRIAQPYVAGIACSVAFLVGRERMVPLVPTQQILSPDGRFAYRGGRLPLPADLAQHAISIATAAIHSVSGLAGYVGVDLVLADDGNDVAIEINPRLTTSYIGLRALCESNLAEAWLQVLDGATDVKLSWRPGAVEFDANGICRNC